jgi:cardiolipin synthase
VNLILQSIGVIGPWLVVFAHFAIALWVTVHVLLHKRDVGSSLGWIGLAWFSPFIGGFFYAMLGINRVSRRARRLHAPRSPRAASITSLAGGSLAALDHATSRITGRAATPDNSITIFHNGDEAYPAMLQAIAGARTSIGLSSYMFRTDRTGQIFIAALAAARQRGVEVRVIIDGVGGGYVSSPAYHALRLAGIPAGRFIHSPLPWRMPLLNLRSHKKILVIDGHTGFTGGLNITDDNVLALHPKTTVLDTHFMVTGPVTSQLTSAFVKDWFFVTNEELTGENWFPALKPSGAAQARVITSGPDRDIEKIEFAVLQAISCARASITIMTPYFLPGDQIVMALTLAAMREIRVDLVIPGQSNHRLVDWATRATIGPMVHEGAHVWFGPPPFRHSKLMTIDGEWSLIGSNNWDIRSFRLNFELSMEVYDKPLAETLGAFIMAHKGEALTAAHLDARPAPARLRDAAVRLLMPYL